MRREITVEVECDNGHHHDIAVWSRYAAPFLLEVKDHEDLNCPECQEPVRPAGWVVAPIVESA